MTAPNLSGKWTLVKNENFEEFLGANGAPWIARKMANKASCEMEVKQPEDNKITTVMKGVEKNLQIGTSFEEKMNDGSLMEVMPKWEGERLLLDYQLKEGSAKPQKQYRYLDGENLVMEMTIGDVTAKRFFQKSS